MDRQTDRQSERERGREGGRESQSVQNMWKLVYYSSRVAYLSIPQSNIFKHIPTYYSGTTIIVIAILPLYLHLRYFQCMWCM